MGWGGQKRSEKSAGASVMKKAYERYETFGEVKFRLVGAKVIQQRMFKDDIWTGARS